MLLIPLLPYRPKGRQAQPAKLPRTCFTSHMIAALILLNTRPTPLSGTLFRRLFNRTLARLLLLDLLRQPLAQRHADVVLLACLAFVPLELVVNAVGEAAEGAAEDGVFAGTAGVDLARGASGSATPAEVGEGGEDGAGGERVESVFRKLMLAFRIVAVRPEPEA